MQNLIVNIKENEYWWGGSAVFSESQPYDKNSSAKISIIDNGFNQSAPFMISSLGRYIHTDSPTNFSFKDGIITVEGDNPICKNAGDCLKDAYLEVMMKYYPFEKKSLPEKFFRTAQYNTWMEFTYYPTQKSVLQYARAIVDNGYTPGIFIIDEGWSVGYGTWEFDFHKFPDPKAMIDELHFYGFTVMLWIVPYVTADGRDYLSHVFPRTSTLLGKEFKPRLVRQPNGKVALLEWWNGVSAMLDLSEDNDRKYLEERLEHLMKDYGVDGFKFDGGNIAALTPKKWVTAPPEKTPEQLNKAWNDFGARYEYHEYKDTYERSGRAVIQRTCDRNHSWDKAGINTLIPYILLQGLLGYPYVCPDMIGGGEWTWNLVADFKCDQELFVRMAQCSALFPMMQFSWAPWRLLDDENQKLCLEASRLHTKFADKIVALVNETPDTSEPIIRSLEYEYPHNGYERINDQFLLGSDILVCPVITKGAVSRIVVLPKGKWRYCDGTEYEGGKEIEVPAPLSVLPYFEKIGF